MSVEFAIVLRNGACIVKEISNKDIELFRNILDGNILPSPYIMWLWNSKTVQFNALETISERRADVEC